MSIVTHSNEIKLVRLVRLAEETDRTPVVARVINLERVMRDPETKPCALSEYRRGVARQQFSPDSQMLVMSDFSGHTASWMLEGD